MSAVYSAEHSILNGPFGAIVDDDVYTRRGLHSEEEAAERTE